MKKVVLFFLLSFLLAPRAQAETWPILISQIMLGQNEGAKNEFIELFNPNDFPVDLASYSLKKKSASGTETNLISNKLFTGIILAKSYFLISNSTFGQKIKSDLNYSGTNSLSQNNTIILYDQNKKISDKLGYGEASDFFSRPTVAPENNQVLKRININYKNPDNSNDFSIETENIQIQNSSGDIINIDNYQEKIISTSSNKTKNTKQKYQISSNLKDLKSLNNGDLIIVEGIVSVLPGVLGTQYFYIHDIYPNDKNVYGVQVYNYNKKFPKLKIGDQIKINGELVKSDSDEITNYKIKTKEIDNISVLSSDHKIPTAKIEKIIDLKTEDIGNIKTIQGEITQNKTNQIFFDDGNEIQIEIKKSSGISSKLLIEGQKFTISGILNYSGSQMKLSIINEEDIIPKNKQTDKSLGDVLDNKFWQLEKQKNNSKILKYLIITIIMTIIYLIFNKKIIKK